MSLKCFNQDLKFSPTPTESTFFQTSITMQIRSETTCFYIITKINLC